MESTFYEVAHDLWVSQDHGAIVTLSNTEIPDDTGKISKVNLPGLGSSEIMFWGEKNTLPQDREDLVKGNGNIGELLKTKRDFTLGGGLVAYRSRWENGKEIRDYVETPAECQAFFDEVGIDRYFRKACRNLMVHANVFTEFIRDKGGRIISMKAMECRHMRAQKQNAKGKVANYYWSGKWHKLRDKDAIAMRIPAYDKLKNQPKFILHSGDDLLFDDYYYLPTWWGSKRWIQLANLIPEFHLANISNGYTIRYHIQIPKDYFTDYSSEAQTPNGIEERRKKESAAKADFQAKMDAFLAGAKNAGKVVYSTYELKRELGKEFPGVKIEAIPVDLKDEAMLRLYDASIKALTAAQGIHPTLANVESQGKLSSGSEMRNAHLVYLKTKTPTNRSILLEALYLVHRELGWDPTIRWDFRDTEITTLDESKSGTIEKTISEE